MLTTQDIADRLGISRRYASALIARGGPCEHQWNGDGWEDDDSDSWSAACSRCGAIALFHDLRCAL